MNSDHHSATKAVRHWFETAVLGLNLCPFAHKPFTDNTIEFEVSASVDDEQALTDLYLALDRLQREPRIETMLLIYPDHLADFDDYNQFLDMAELMLEQRDLESVFQIASFHPHYQFADSLPGDRENWTNRSPFPILHLLRQDAISRAIDHHPEVNSIPARNIQRLNTLNDDQMIEIFGDRYRRES